MILPTFEFYQPTAMDEACALMAHHRHEARLLAGGTDLLVNMKKKLLNPAHLVSLGRIPELNRLENDGGRIWIGAGVTVATLAVSEMIAGSLGALGQGARALGTPLIRNLATIGGNIGSARPAADLPPALMVYDARIVLTGAAGQRRMPVAEFFKGPGLTAAGDDELIAAVEVPVPSAHCGAGYLNLGVRKAQDCNIVNVASFVGLDSERERMNTVRIALGSVGPTPLYAKSAENVLIGQKPTDALLDQAAAAAAGDCTPILDFRGSAEYRRDMVTVLTRRALEMALAEARRKP